MSTVFRTLFQASTVKSERIRAVWLRCLAECHVLSHVRGHESELRSFSFLKTKELSSWNIIKDLWLKHPKDWFYTSFDMFLRTVMELFDFSPGLSACASWIWICELNARTKRRNLDINDGLYWTKQTFIVELGLLGVHSDEDHQR